MSLRYAILGYLSTGPGTGWDISCQFDTGLGWFWTARHSQIYPELKRMTHDGLVERDSKTVGEAQILDALREHTHERINVRVANRPGERSALTVGLRELACQGELERAELEIAWAGKALTWLDESTRY